MNHIIYNISVILIFFGAILLTHNLTKSNSKCLIQSTNKNKQDNKQILNQDRPSQIFNKMFDRSDVWMGYADFDVKGIQNKLI
jgi:poly(A) polymerase Pap1